MGVSLLVSLFVSRITQKWKGRRKGWDTSGTVKSTRCKRQNGARHVSSEIYVSGEWPDYFLDSVIIPIDKKCGAQDCVDFRTISLVSHASKIVLKILNRRLESTAESYLEKDQFGFRKGRGTRDT